MKTVCAKFQKSCRKYLLQSTYLTIYSINQQRQIFNKIFTSAYSTFEPYLLSRIFITEEPRRRRNHQGSETLPSRGHWW